jgi:hypothetical protein
VQLIDKFAGMGDDQHAVIRNQAVSEEIRGHFGHDQRLA